LSRQDKANLMSRIGACLAAPCDESMRALHEQVLIDSLCDLLRQRNRTSELESNRQHRRHKRLLRVIDHLNAQHHRLVSVPEMASAAGLTERTLRRYFREHFGLSPLQYDRARRLNYARRMLANGSTINATVTEAALNTGFEQLGRFSRDFRSLFGVSPSVFVADNARKTKSVGGTGISHDHWHSI
jgi:AraC-like DNA-binding protein